jgi:hypothetical protein
MKSVFLLFSTFLLFFTSLNAEVIKDIQTTSETKTKPWALLRRVNINIGEDLTPAELEDGILKIENGRLSRCH